MLIKIRELKLNLGTYAVLRDVNLTLQKCQINGLPGPNGAGKSTTISVITGLRVPTAGSVRVISDDDGAIIEVVDSGPGIPVSERERVFDSFYRMPGTAGEGSGLGFAIAREAAVRLAGC